MRRYDRQNAWRCRRKRAHTSGAQHIIVTNRSPAKAEALAAEIDGIAKPAARRAARGGRCRVSSTRSREPILTKGLFKKVTKARRYRQIVVIDIAVPRDAEPAIGDMENVFLYDIDDLEKVVASNLVNRAKAAEQAHKIVEHEAGQFEHWLRSQGAVPTIRALREKFSAIADAEVHKIFEQLARKEHTREQQREVIQRLVQLVVNKLLHQPTAALREARGRGHAARRGPVRPVRARARPRRGRAGHPRAGARTRRQKGSPLNRIVIATRGSALALWQASTRRRASPPCSPTSPSTST